MPLLAALAAEAPIAPIAAPPVGPASTNGQYTSRLLVDRWLTDRGVAFRIKSQPDGRGRTVYVLAQCPFDSTHGDPDACVMQEPNGKMSAQCFHNGCQGRGWQAFKEALGPPDRHHYDPPLSQRQRRSKKKRRAAPGPTDGEVGPVASANGATTAATDLPWIQINNRQLRDVTAEACAALRARNDPPTTFQRGGVLTRLRFREDNGAPILEPLVDAALRGVLARVANWMRLRETKEGSIAEEDAPSIEVVKDLANLPTWEGIPVIDRVVECPVFSRTGDLVSSPGFHPAARLWYHPSVGLDVPPVPSDPTPTEIEQARDLIMVELLGDFPFIGEASKAHALAALLLPFVRDLIDGPTPLHLLDAPVEGTGKTLLATVIAMISSGRDVEAIAEGSCDEEWRKRITALLVEAPTFILLDNINRTLDASALASVLTARVWRDRILGQTKTVTLPNTCVWLASGNNTRMSRELIRRTVWCRLDSGAEAPWERTDFRHPNLTRWTRDNRDQLVGAALTLCQAWIAKGRPAGTQAFGMFESWVEVIGGILDLAGVPGLLANAKELRATRADKVSEWRAFVVSWWQEYADRTVGVEDLFRLVTEQNLLDSVLGDKGEKSQRTRLGLAMGKAADRVYGEYRIERAGEDHKGRQQYRLKRQPTEPTAGEEICECQA